MLHYVFFMPNIPETSANVYVRNQEDLTHGASGLEYRKQRFILLKWLSTKDIKGHTTPIY